MLSGTWLTDTLYVVARAGASQLWCIGCCTHHGEKARTAPPGACMSMVGVVPSADSGAPPAGVRVFGDMAQLIAFATTHHLAHEATTRAREAKRQPVG